MNERIIPLKTLRNLRTLGGMQTQQGKRIRDNILYRSAALNKIKPKDAKRLRDIYQVKTVIDLRTRDEVKKKPDIEVDGITRLYLPICEDQMPGISREVEPGKTIEPGMLPDMRDLYRDVVMDPECLAHFSTVLKTIMQNRDGAILWHCTAGKDRCGLTAVFLETMLGVSEQDILDDYLLTNLDSIKSAKKYSRMVRLLKRDKELAQHVYEVYLAKESYLASALQTIQKEYGSMDQFFEQQLKIDKEEIQAFREYALQ